MRKLLLASVATLGFAGSAYAAGLVEINQATSPPAVGDATGVVKAAPITAWNAPKLNPDPGKVIIHVDGLVAVDAGVFQSPALYGTAGSPNAAAKGDHYNMGGYFRLYLGFDGKLTNGMIYGAMSEMRTDFAGAAGGAGNYSVTGSIGNGSSNSTASLWYTRRAYLYMGAPNVGLFRLGQGDGVTSLFTQPSITTGEAYDTGQWDGDICDIVPGNACLAWAFNDVGNEYDPMKIVYMTPSFAGFVFAVDFAPNSAALSAAPNNNAATGGLPNQASSTLATDFARPRNTFEVGGRYTGTFGPVSIETSVAFQKSAVVNNASLTSPGVKFKGVDAIDTGLGVTAFGASVFGHLYTGTMNGTVTPQAEIAGRSRNGVSWIEGAMYTWGPWTAGASYYTFQSEGATAATAAIPAGFPGAGTSVVLGNRVERGFDTGFTYNLAPGCNLFGDYIIGWRHQVGVNFDDPAGTPKAGNNMYTAGFITSAVFFW
jgi:hypothetical protein